MTSVGFACENCFGKGCETCDHGTLWFIEEYKLDDALAEVERLRSEVERILLCANGARCLIERLRAGSMAPTILIEQALRELDEALSGSSVSGETTRP